MYWNDLPQAIVSAVDGKIVNFAGQTATAELVGRSGDDIRAYLDPDFTDYQYGIKPGQTYLEKVRDENFDVVALMVFTRFITEGSTAFAENLHARAISEYCRAIRAAGGEPLFYESGWGDTDRDELGRERILKLSKSHGVLHFAPCASAWKRVRRERPDIELQHPQDSVHPGDVGHFLNLACFYAAITRQSPQGQLPRTFSVWHHMSPEEKSANAELIADAVASFQPNAYQASLPRWMQEYAAAGSQYSLSESDALYLESVAWETWQKVDSVLRPSPR